MKPIYFSLMVLWALPIAAQDPHFSQIYSAPFYQTAALAGFSKYALRAGSGYRGQWMPILGIKSAYQTTSLWADGNWGDCNRFGLGIGLLSDKAGEAPFTQQRGQISASYQLALSENITLSAGGSVVVQSNRIDLSSTRFVSQYGTDGIFNPSLNTPITFDKMKKTWVDASLGIMLVHRKKGWREEDKIYTIGIAADHLTKPNVSFLNNEKINLPMRWTAQAGIEHPLSKNTVFQAQITGFLQGKIWETDIGMGMRFELENDYSWTIGASCRLAQRLQNQFLADAAILRTQYSAPNWVIGVSYDMNISALSAANHWNNAVELNFILLLKVRNGADCIVCPNK